jgi:hypothetical protein
MLTSSIAAVERAVQTTLAASAPVSPGVASLSAAPRTARSPLGGGLGVQLEFGVAGNGVEVSIGLKHGESGAHRNRRD